MKKIKSSVLSVLALSLLSTACIEMGAANLLKKKDSDSSPKKEKSNLVTNKSSSVDQEIGDEKVKMHVISQKELRMQELAGKVLGVDSQAAMKLISKLPHTTAVVNKKMTNKNLKMVAAPQESLSLGFPVGLIGEQSVFGGVITKVSDKVSETLGTLKLTDLTPIHVRPMVAADGDDLYLALIGCASECDEDSAQEALIYIPITKISDDGEMVYLDLSAIGKGLDLIKMLDRTGAYTKLISISSATTAFDYSFSTLVFDIVSTMVPVGTKVEDYAATPKTEFTVRWYLKLTSGSNPSFKSRPATEGVGFFQTDRSKESKITRFSTTDFGKTVKYYVKNVPEKYKPVFASAFNNWNTEFTKIIGRDLLSYEFIESSDPEKSHITAGDIRYNVMEWDLNNIASYGGLGPSIANQFTGETMSANVLIQGPTIIELYTKWFALSQTARNLIAEGRSNEANAIVAKFNKEAKAELANRSKVKFAVKLGNLEMNVHAQEVELEDPMIKNHFEIVPAGITFDAYMTGYFTEMLEHELGHNLGLRHNFKGNLGAYETGEKGSVSRSIMEYLGRPYR
ncbi:MAG: zinc-dependent metalloprotease, partial [Bdellovibrionales bacterium]|nr:zinc-dependent metalloprotease [Bdellovibrionales bacterium]